MSEYKRSILSGSSDELENAEHLSVKELGVRLRAARESLKISRGDAATSINVAVSTLQAWENGDREAGFLQVKQLCRLYDVSLDDIFRFNAATRVSDKIADYVVSTTPVVDTLGHPVDVSEFVFIPRYFVAASAGNGAVLSDENRRDTIAFHRKWLQDTFYNTRPEDIAAISVIGDSMEPTLRQRDVILIDRSTTNVSDGVFVISLDGQLMVKRLQRQSSNQILVISDNSAYPSIVLQYDRINDLRVCGCVKWVGRTI